MANSLYSSKTTNILTNENSERIIKITSPKIICRTNSASPMPKLHLNYSVPNKNIIRNNIIPNLKYNSTIIQNNSFKNNEYINNWKEFYEKEIEKLKKYYHEKNKIIVDENRVLSEFIQKNKKNDDYSIKFEEFENKLKILEEKNCLLIDKLNSCNEEIINLNEKYAEKIKENNELFRKNMDFNAEINEKNQEIEKLENENNFLEQENFEKNAIINELNEKIENIEVRKTKIEALIKNNLILNDLIEKKNNELLIKNAGKIDQNPELIAFSTHISQLNTQLQILSSENIALKNENNKLHEANMTKFNEKQYFLNLINEKNIENDIKLLNLSNDLEFYKQFYLNKSEELIDESKTQNKFENQIIYLKNLLKIHQENHKNLQDLNNERRKEFDEILIRNKELRKDNLELKQNKQELEGDILILKEREILRNEEWQSKRQELELLKTTYQNCFNEINQKNILLVENLININP